MTDLIRDHTTPKAAKPNHSITALVSLQVASSSSPQPASLHDVRRITLSHAVAQAQQRLGNPVDVPAEVTRLMDHLRSMAFENEPEEDEEEEERFPREGDALHNKRVRHVEEKQNRCR